MATLLILALPPVNKNIYAQDTYTAQEKEVIIQNAVTLESITTDSTDIKMLAGKVVLLQGDVIFECDSAVVFYRNNTFDAFGHIHINQHDTLHIYGNEFSYSGDDRIAIMKGDVLLEDCSAKAKSDRLDYYLNQDLAILLDNVHITDQKVKVETDSLRYFTKTKRAYLFGKNKYTGEDGNVLESSVMEYDFLTQSGNYEGRGRIINDNTIIESDKAIFDEVQKKTVFLGNVAINDPDYQLITPHLTYYTETEKAFFEGETRIDKDSTIIKSNTGWYDKKNKIISLGGGAVVLSKEQNIKADSIYFDDAKGMGYCFSNVEIEDTLNKSLITSHYIHFISNTDYMLATENPLLRNVSREGDTLYLLADTLTSTGDGKKSPRKINAYANVWMHRPDFQGLCDSLYYSSADSMFRFFRKPVLWLDSTQLSADTIFFHVPHNKPESIRLLENAMVISWLEQDVFNQLKGRYIQGLFAQNKIRQMNVDSLAESIYFAQDKNKAYLGANRSLSASMQINFKEGKAEKVKFYDHPKAEFTPMRQVNITGFRLLGFRWLQELRPLGLTDMKTKRKEKRNAILFLEPDPTLEPLDKAKEAPALPLVPEAGTKDSDNPIKNGKLKMGGGG